MKRLTAFAFLLLAFAASAFGQVTQQVTITVTVSVISPLTVQPFSCGFVIGQATPLSCQIVVTGGKKPYSFALVAGVLPPGLTLGPSTGLISGTPTTPTVGSPGCVLGPVKADGTQDLVCTYTPSIRVTSAP